ncbi:hypothetical protein GA0115246_103974 [Streptomyces sp. SolWspMP-sol7th]|nr:hypothetical protein GA0115246_103974 [Streptomyces sp. SolWspMP-sol7th]
MKVPSPAAKRAPDARRKAGVPARWGGGSASGEAGVRAVGAEEPAAEGSSARGGVTRKMYA